jgi:hypothetical protein
MIYDITHVIDHLLVCESMSAHVFFDLGINIMKELTDYLSWPIHITDEELDMTFLKKTQKTSFCFLSLLLTGSIQLLVSHCA